jgi:elongin-C
MATNGQELSKYVTLVSSDGFEFVVLREAACVSGAIKRMLDPKSMLLQTSPVNAVRYFMTDCCSPGNFAESVNGRCTFEEIKYVFIFISPG